MTNLGFWLVWTIVSALGIKYSANTLLEQDISFISSVVIILAYQWIRFIKPPEVKKTENNNTNKNIKRTNTQKKIK